jgi:pimeloyl-ACP methyl ester carboxylesterase
MADELNLRITGVDPGDEIAGARRVTIRTTRGPIALVLHGASEPARVALCMCGAIGGLDGPAMLYPRLGLELPRMGVAIARLNYRAPNEFGECVLDAMAALSFLRGTGYRRAALVGHSFGGAVVINAGTLAPMVTTVVALSSQLAGARHRRHHPVARVVAGAIRTRPGTAHDQAGGGRRSHLPRPRRRVVRHGPRLAGRENLTLARPSVIHDAGHARLRGVPDNSSDKDGLPIWPSRIHRASNRAR